MPCDREAERLAGCTAVRGGRCAEVRDAVVHSVKWTDPIVRDKKLSAALSVGLKQSGAPREAKPATGYTVLITVLPS